ncbi:MAG: SIR2 family NAD-dependent protein deacylase [archaeon]
MMKKIVAFTGAGVSKASGIPTFEENGDIRKYLHRNYFNQEPERFYKKLIEFGSNLNKAKPNSAHKALAKYNIPVITMNVDRLHQKAGSKEVIEVHGNIEKIHCPECINDFPFKYGGKNHTCPDCGSVLQHDIILYGDGLPLGAIQKAFKLIENADELIVIGTSFYTSTSSMVVNHAKDRNIKVTLFNEDAEKKIPKYLKQILK